MDTVWVDIEKRGRSFVIKDSSRPKLDDAYLKMLKNLNVSAATPTGTQAQLTPTEAKQPSPPAARQEEPPVSAGKTIQMPTAEPEYEYTVEAAKVQSGMTGKSTSLTLADQDGKRLQAFGRGALEDLAPGVRLKNVKLTLRQQSTVAFHVLEHYEIVAPMERAA